MKRILLGMPMVCFVAGLACGARGAAAKFQQKLVVIGFDGLDPTLVRKWMAEGKESELVSGVTYVENAAELQVGLADGYLAS